MGKILLLCQQCGCPFELSPARYQLISELRKRGHEIYVFFPGTIPDRKVKSGINHLINTRNLSIREIRNKIINVMPTHIIAFTYEDAQILYVLPKIMKKTSFIYYNLEIYTPYMERYVQPKGDLFYARCMAVYIKNKIKEIIFTRHCDLFIIQDALRAKTSAKYLIHHPNTMLIPNSYIFREEEKAAADCEGVIYSGGLNKLQTESLAEGFHAIADLPITFSGWSDEWFMTQYKKVCKTHPNIKLFNQKLSPEEYTEFLKQFAVGLIWYSPSHDENVHNIGLASGKFFKHLSLGQPVIAMDCPGIGNIVHKYELGIVIHDAAEIRWAYKKIVNNYMYYQKNVRYIYKNKFDYARAIRPLLKQLEEGCF